MGRPLWIHKNHHSSCKIVSSLYDSIALLIFQLFARFVNKAILRSFGSTNLLLQRPPVSHGFIHQKPLHLGKRLTYALSLLALHSPLCRCSRLCCSYFSTLPLQSREHYISWNPADRIQPPVPFCLHSPRIITIIKAAAAWNRFLLSRVVKNSRAFSPTLAWQETRKAAPILFQ